MFSTTAASRRQRGKEDSPAAGWQLRIMRRRFRRTSFSTPSERHRSSKNAKNAALKFNFPGGIFRPMRTMKDNLIPLNSEGKMTRKKLIDWITYGINLLVALPVFGLISCGIFWIIYQVIFPHTNPPDWARWSFPLLFALILIALWSRYQYRVLILKTPRPPHETRRSLLILAGCVTIAFLLILGLARCLERERMEKAKKKIQEIEKKQKIVE